MRTLRRSRWLATVALACSLLAACGSRMSGHYKNPNELMEIEFKGSNTAYLSMIGTTMEVKYRVDGDHVVFDTPQGQLVFTRNPNGTLEGAGFVLSKTD
jgi:hypothetical protein